MALHDTSPPLPQIAAQAALGSAQIPDTSPVKRHLGICLLSPFQRQTKLLLQRRRGWLYPSQTLPLDGFLRAWVNANYGDIG